MIRKQADHDASDADPATRAPDAEVVVAEFSGEEPESRKQLIGHVIYQITLALVILVASIGVTMLLVNLKTRPASVPEARAAPRVSALHVEVGDVPTLISGFGTVRATRQLQLAPQVGGRVIEVHPGLLAGGTLPAGAVVLRIDPTDYELALAGAEADLRRAEAGLRRIESSHRAAAAEVARRQTALQTQQAEADVARREFERLNPGRPIPPLVAREPQVAEARAALEAAQAAAEDVTAQEAELEAARAQAESALRLAQVNLSRTELRLPEGGGPWRVQSQGIDVGQTALAGQVVAVLWDAATLEVPVPLEDTQLQWIEFPQGDQVLGDPGQAPPSAASPRAGATRAVGEPSAQATPASRGDAAGDAPGGSNAVILDDFAGGERRWPARVSRAEGMIDPRTRLVGVIVAAQSARSEDGVASLVPGAFVQVEIQGTTLEGVAALPRRALRRDERTGRDVVHVAQDGRLRIVPVQVARRSGEVVYVRGLTSGDAVILSRLELVSEGMEIQIAAASGSADEGGDAPPVAEE